MRNRKDNGYPFKAIERQLKQVGQLVDEEAVKFIEGAEKYLIAELMEKSIEATKKAGLTTIGYEQIVSAINCDKELKKLMQGDIKPKNMFEQ